MIQSVSKTVTPNGTTQIGSRIRGCILAVSVTSDAAATTAFDIELTGNTTGIPILNDDTIANNSTVWWHPRAFATKNTDGADATDAFVKIPVLNESIKCVIANTAAGVITVAVYYDSDE
jgi:hypothetical protein